MKESPSMFVREVGAAGAPAVVFLPGAGASGTMWAEHLARLEGGFHCLAVDLPGFGRSNRMGFLSRPVTADLVAELIAERVPTGRAHVVALSWGGGVAHTLLDRHPDRVDRAVIDGAGVLTARSDRAVGDRASGAALLLGVDMSETPRPPGRPRHRTTKEEPAGLCLLAGLGVTPARRRP